MSDSLEKIYGAEALPDVAGSFQRRMVRDCALYVTQKEAPCFAL